MSAVLFLTWMCVGAGSHKLADMMESKWLTPQQSVPFSWDVGGELKCVIQLNNSCSRMLLAQLFPFIFFPSYNGKNVEHILIFTI